MLTQHLVDSFTRRVSFFLCVLTFWSPLITERALRDGATSTDQNSLFYRRMTSPTGLVLVGHNVFAGIPRKERSSMIANRPSSKDSKNLNSSPVRQRQALTQICRGCRKEWRKQRKRRLKVDNFLYVESRFTSSTTRDWTCGPQRNVTISAKNPVSVHPICYTRSIGSCATKRRMKKILYGRKRTFTGFF